MKIGKVAAQARVNIQTLRYYERRGILKPPKRTPAGYREYPADAVDLVSFIKGAQELGFTLGEIEELLRLRTGRGSCAKARASAVSKLEDIDAKLRSLRAMRRALKQLVETCDAEGSDLTCPIIEALNQTNGHARGSSD